MATSSGRKKKRKLGTVDLVFLYGFAFLFDLLGIVPLLGAMYIGVVRFVFWLKGMNNSLINTVFAATTGIETIPAISLLPACTIFVFTAHMIDIAQSGEMGDVVAEGVDAASKVAGGKLLSGPGSVDVPISGKKAA